LKIESLEMEGRSNAWIEEDILRNEEVPVFTPHRENLKLDDYYQRRGGQKSVIRKALKGG